MSKLARAMLREVDVNKIHSDPTIRGNSDTCRTSRAEDNDLENLLHYKRAENLLHYSNFQRNCEKDPKLERASPRKRLRILNIVEDIVEHIDELRNSKLHIELALSSEN
ncbi:hypothetical protein L195_g006351 [Trifolium pratense]|uniref:Uncharacterized protein n=1 Tax=Trifolium pratense TaxID=57577 RepID=A0A2K3P3H3_TRIPR|nr:hypothetical protein L195_g006351 [Trifolium pratense]